MARILSAWRKSFDMKKNNFKLWSRICFGLSALCLAVGASFHGYRMHPENAQGYRLGVTIGITMIVSFALFFLTGIILTMIGKRK